jgi:glycerophosphoryl diester phosphodiesterase
MKTLFLALLLAPVIALAQTRVIAHRGYWDKLGSAQNSISSLKNAINIHVHGSELDARLTLDTILVLNHDDAYQGVKIQTATLAQLAHLRLHNGEPIPTLQQYIDTAAKQTRTKLIIEIKTHDTPAADSLAATLAVALVNAAGIAHRVDYISFSPHACRVLINLDPAHRVAYLNGDKSPATLKAEGFWGLDYPWRILAEEHPEWIAEAKALGLTTNVWTVNDLPLAKHFIAQGIDYITTDNPQLLVGLLAK